MGTPITWLARDYQVTRQTIYDTIKDARLGIFLNRSSMNNRYRSVAWGFRRFARTEAKLEITLARRAHRLKRYEKEVPGEMVHLDTKRLPLLRGEAVVQPREYLFVAIDDHSRFTFADIFPDKTSWSAAIFLEEVRLALPFVTTGIYSDNGSEYRGKAGHPVYDLCRDAGINQSFTKVKHPWTNGKAERFIKTLMTEWHPRSAPGFISRDHRRRYLYAYVDWYNQVRVHQTIGCTPISKLETYLKSVYDP